MVPAGNLTKMALGEGLKDGGVQRIGYEAAGPANVSHAIALELERDRSRTSRYHRRGFLIAKRGFDIVLSSISLIVLSPVFLLITITLGCVQGFPVSFRQKRIGLNGKLFSIHKYRTMVRDAEDVLRAHPELMAEYKKKYKIEKDPRVSKFGHFLRKSSLDELPQLLNVFKGEMSLVGPRPIVEPEIEMYGDQDYVYKAMKPGCAGLWQCMGRSATTYQARVELDREYFENASIWFDVVILFRTVVAIATGRGAR